MLNRTPSNITHHCTTQGYAHTTQSLSHSLGGDEGVLLDGGQDVTELDLGGEGVSVVDDWHPVRTIPAVHCTHTTTTTTNN